MSYSITQAKADLTGMLHGTSLSQIQNINGVLNRAGRQLMLDIDPAETKRIAQLATPVFYQVFDYAAPDDLKGNKVIDIFPQVSRTPDQNWGQTYNKNFDLHKLTSIINSFTVLNNSGTKTLRIETNDNTNCILINPISNITANGTWATGGTASNLMVNTGVMINGSPVLQFDVATGTGTMLNSTMTAVDLTNHANLSTIFIDVYLFHAADVTSLNLRFGSSAGDYYGKTGITTNYAGTAFVDGWNTIGVDWIDFTVTGAPDASAINLAELDVTTSANIYGAKAAQLWSKLGTLMNIEYYSKFAFRTAAGVWGDTTAAGSDQVNLDTESYNIFLFLAQLYCTQQALGQDAGYDTQLSNTWYQNAITRYKKMYKSEITKPQQMYYKRTFRNYNDSFGRGGMWSNN